MPTHFKSLMNPDYIGAYAFQPNEEKIGTIAYVKEEQVMGPDGKKEECIVAHFQERELKPLILNVTNCKMIAKLYKTPYIEDWAGKRIIMRVQQVKAFGDIVDAVRIKAEVPKAVKTAPKATAPTDYVCAECGQIIQPFGQMTAGQLAAYTVQKYGKSLCADCAKSVADKQTEQAVPNAAAPTQEG